MRWLFEQLGNIYVILTHFFKGIKQSIFEK